MKDRFTRDEIIHSHRGERATTNSFNVMLDGEFLFFVGMPMGNIDKRILEDFATTLVAALNRDTDSYPSIFNLSLGRIQVP